MFAAAATSASARPGLLRRGLAALGGGATAWATWALSVAALAGIAVWRIGPGFRRLRPVTREVLIRQILFTGVEAMPFTGLIAAFVGATVILQAQRNISAAASAAVLAKLLVVVIVRELGPLVAAIIVIGRSGTAMTVELGNMRVVGETGALEAQGVDPVEYLVVPRVGGMAASLAALSLFFVGVSMAFGVVASGLISGNFAAPFEFAVMLAEAAGLEDIAAMIAKTLLPGVLIAAIACYEGLSAGPDMTDVPRAATRGTVRALSATFAINAAISALVYLV
ncbi:MAG: hypothetical protein RIT45_2791 [Pseudomonadota bacterium]